jgi:hypothetical protein
MTTGPAVVRARRSSGKVQAFQASHCEIANGFVTATGVWRGEPAPREQVLVWPMSSVIEVRFRGQPKR